MSQQKKEFQHEERPDRNKYISETISIVFSAQWWPFFLHSMLVQMIHTNISFDNLLGIIPCIYYQVSLITVNLASGRI